MIYTGPHYHSEKNWETGKMVTQPVDGEPQFEEESYIVWKCSQCKYISNTEKAATSHFQKYHNGPVSVSRVEEVIRRYIGTKVE